MHAFLPAALVTGKAPGFLMVASAAVLAFLQETTVPPAETVVGSVFQVVALVLGGGGVGYLLIKTMASEYSKGRERQREIDKEERAEDRRERERQYTDHKELSARLIAAYDAQVQTLRDELLTTRTRKDHILDLLLERADGHDETHPLP